ncbi:MAG TPA: hypothetical protein V6C95_05045 [Coleofasciculaceae cyanobacterium]
MYWYLVVGDGAIAYWDEVRSLMAPAKATQIPDFFGETLITECISFRSRGSDGN